MEFLSEFFMGEEREGFYIPPLMKRVWAVQLEVLEVVSSICERHNLQFYADWGTLLGAIRHQGYIPWDDDIDIAMKRDDYNKFYNYAIKELSSGYELKFYKSRNECKRIHMTIYNSAKVCIDREYLLRNHGCPIPSGLDIYPLDVMPKLKEELDFQMQMLSIPYQLLYCSPKEGISDSVLQEVSELFRCQLINDSNLPYQLIDIIEKVSQLYNDDGGELYTEYSALLDHYTYSVERKCFDKVEYRKFENIQIPVPSGYHEILTSIYGDYMKPVQGCSSHGYPYYKNQEIKLLEAIRKASLNMSVTEYCDYVMMQNDKS